MWFISRQISGFQGDRNFGRVFEFVAKLLPFPTQFRQKSGLHLSPERDRQGKRFFRF